MPHPGYLFSFSAFHLYPGKGQMRKFNLHWYAYGNGHLVSWLKWQAGARHQAFGTRLLFPVTHGRFLPPRTYSVFVNWGCLRALCGG